jgi:D-tyrosyl-tRNA(Tyr) deacylase
MRAVLQRVSSASVSVHNKEIACIGAGLLVLLAVHQNDDDTVIPWMINKLLQCRIFSDADGKMNLSVCDVQGGLLLVSQFTLYGDCKKGNRPNFMQSASPDKARFIYNEFLSQLKQAYADVQAGKFAASMQVALVNDGPVTVIIDS